MKKNTKTKSEPKSERAGLLNEHDRIEHQLAKLKQAADDSDRVTISTIEKATAVYTAAANKAQAAFDAAITKAQKALKNATAKANKVNNDERDAVAKVKGPLKRRLLFLKSEVRREFVVEQPCLATAALPPCGRVMRKPVRTAWEANLPEGVWSTRSGSIWERRRTGGVLEIRRVS